MAKNPSLTADIENRFLLSWTHSYVRCVHALNPQQRKVLARTNALKLFTEATAVALFAVSSGHDDAEGLCVSALKMVIAQGKITPAVLEMLDLEPRKQYSAKEIAWLADRRQDGDKKLGINYQTWLAIVATILPQRKSLSPEVLWLHQARGVVFVNDTLYLASDYEHHAAEVHHPRGTWLEQLATFVTVRRKLIPLQDGPNVFKQAIQAVGDFTVPVVLVDIDGALAPPQTLTIKEIEARWFPNHKCKKAMK